MRKFSIAAGIFLMAVFTGCIKEINPINQASDVTPSTSISGQGSTGRFVPNELIVKFKTGIIASGRMSALAKIKGEVQEQILTKTMQRFNDNEGIFLMHTPLDVFDAIAALKALPEVEYAEPNYIYQHEAASNDPYYTNGSLWGMYGSSTSPTNQYGSQAGSAWAAGHTGSSSVFIGIIDEGAMYNHEDLSANFWNNPYETVNGIDDDGNGFVDDIRGWDFVSNDNSTFDGTADDHGTHVSGTIGGKGGNSKGVAGVNWNVTMISAKFLGTNGGTTANAVKAVDYITGLKTLHPTMNIVATNNSWGGGGFSQALQDAIERANAANILFVAAAGNSSANIDASPSYPASYTNANIISVAAITSTGGLASFSNYGSTSVDIGAPGSGVYSTVPARQGNKIISSYASYSGTSMATPHVTGAAALYASTHSNASAADIKAAILGSAVSTSSLSGKCATGGRLNVSGF